MEILNASDAKREFGDMLMKAQQAPIGINKNGGKPIRTGTSRDIKPYHACPNSSSSNSSSSFAQALGYDRLAY